VVRDLLEERPTLKAHAHSVPVDLPGSWWFTELPHQEVGRKGGSVLGSFLAGFVLGMFALAVVVVLTINVKTRGGSS
jgi:hypothetical protein